MVDDKNNVMMGDIRLAIKTPVKTGTANNQTDIWNVPFKDSAKAAMDSESALSCKKSGYGKDKQGNQNRWDCRYQHIADMGEQWRMCHC